MRIEFGGQRAGERRVREVQRIQGVRRSTPCVNSEAGTAPRRSSGGAKSLRSSPAAGGDSTSRGPAGRRSRRWVMVALLRVELVLEGYNND